MFRDKKEEFQGEFGMFTNLDKMMVIQDAQVFNESPLNFRRCRQILSKLLWLLYQSERLTSKEATNMFFAATKAFQCKDSALRRLTYVLIKEMAHLSEDVIIVTSSLTQDIGSKDTDLVQFRGNALRTLAVVIDGSMLAAVERFFKQAIVERDQSVASASLLSAVHLWQAAAGNQEVVRRWLAEVQQALNAAPGKSIVQYHALGLLCLLKAGDRMGLMKLVQQLSRSATNPLALCLFLRLYGQLLASDPNNNTVLDLKLYLRSSAGLKGEMVSLEVARIICDRAGDVYTHELDHIITALQSMLGSARAVVRFAALRLLNDLASKWPGRVARCNADIEGLVTHANRNVATLAITCLLKTGDEASVDRLIRQIRTYVGDISDEFRVIVVDAVRALGLKFPSKHASLLDFLGSVLREEGARAYKQACVDAICELMESIPEAREAALLHLCEFIEDSEYPELTAQILYLLGSLGPATLHPSKLIRYIYNRLVLEDAPVRVAALGALAKFGAAESSLRPGIESIIRRSLNDPNEDVVDRARLALAQFKEQQPEEPRVPDLDALEAALQAYCADTSPDAKPFSMEDIPTLPLSDVFRAAKRSRMEQIVPSAVASPKHEVEASYNTIDTALPDWAITSYGELFKSTPLTPLTDPGAEYTVSARKHIFQAHILLEFVCKNTVPGVLLSDVSLQVQPDEASVRVLECKPIRSLLAEQSDSCYVLLSRNSSDPVSLSCALTFRSQECDPTSGAPLEAGFIDRFALDSPLDIGLADCCRPRDSFDLASDWESHPHQSIQTFALATLPSIPDAISAILELYGLRALSGSGAFDPSVPVHTLLMAGEILGGGAFCLRCRMAVARTGGVNLELAVRADTQDAVDALISAIA